MGNRDMYNLVTPTLVTGRSLGAASAVSLPIRNSPDGTNSIWHSKELTKLAKWLRSVSGTIGAVSVRAVVGATARFASFAGSMTAMVGVGLAISSASSR